MKSLRELASDIVATHRRDLQPYQVLDKNIGPGGHCYIDHVYESLFAPYRLSAKKVLEIGIYNGGSMLLWQRYFPYSEIYGIDIDPSQFFWTKNERIKLSLCDAYTEESVNALSDDYDIIIDDGPHTLDSMRFAIKHYITKLSVNGVLVIEDIPDSSWTKQLMDDVFQSDYKVQTQVIDLRKINGRYDDMLLVVQRLG